MTVEINRRNATPEDWEDLARDFKPLEVEERDQMLTRVGDDYMIRRQDRRVRIVRYIAKDGDEIKSLIWDKGPATGEDPISVMCGGVTDLAQVHEIFEKHQAETYPEMLRRRAESQEERDERYIRGLEREAHEQQMRKTGASTFGSLVTRQRETNGA